MKKLIVPGLLMAAALRSEAFSLLILTLLTAWAVSGLMAAAASRC